MVSRFELSRPLFWWPDSVFLHSPMRHETLVATLKKKDTKIDPIAPGKGSQPLGHFSPCALLLGHPYQVSQSALGRLWGYDGSREMVPFSLSEICPYFSISDSLLSGRIHLGLPSRSGGQPGSFPGQDTAATSPVRRPLPIRLLPLPPRRKGLFILTLTGFPIHSHYLPSLPYPFHDFTTNKGMTKGIKAAVQC
jgi:hypothetical protein